MKALSRLLRRLSEGEGSSTDVGVASLLAVGVLVLTIAEPLWFLRVFTDALPWLTGSLLAATGLSTTALLAVWAGAFVPATVVVTLIVSRWLDEHGEAHPHLRDRIQLRAIVTAAFAVGFFAARAFVFAGSLPAPGGTTVDSFIPVNEVWVQGHHIHHFFFGFALVAVAGWVALFRDGLDRRRTAALYGVGLGVFIDEIGLLLTWGDYWARSSWFVLAAVLTLFLAATVGSWLKAATSLTEDGADEPAAEADAGA